MQNLNLHEFHSLLQDAGLRLSPVRILIIKALFDARAPLSSLELENLLETVDRSSITRTLILFTEKNIVHTVDDGSGSMKYELCRDPFSHAHTDEHPHFRCIVCGETTCIHQQNIPEITLPDDYTPISANYVIKGICPKCNRR